MNNINSNTTLVKVKWGDYMLKNTKYTFKYNSC